MRAYVEVDLGAIAANIRAVKARTDSEILAVVKADAYGHGLIPVAKAALNAGASWLGVALLEEAITLRILWCCTNIQCKVELFIKLIE